MGIVKKNAIMMIDFAIDAERERGLAPLAAIEEACLLRFRPIMMTTMAALLGALPLVIERGIGLGAALAARRHDHRRPAAQPAADALHDAGDLLYMERLRLRFARGAPALAVSAARCPFPLPPGAGNGQVPPARAERRVRPPIPAKRMPRHGGRP